MDVEWTELNWSETEFGETKIFHELDNLLFIEIFLLN